MLSPNGGSIYEPTHSRLRPWNLTTLMFFFIGRFLGRLLSKQEKR
jgi:hypothetical protein